ATYIAGRVVILQGVDAIETRNAELAMSQLHRHLRAMVAHVSGLTVDWACWDDMYDYIRTRNADFIEKNFNELSLEKLFIHTAAIYEKENCPIVFTTTEERDNNSDFAATEYTLFNKLTNKMYRGDITELSGFINIHDKPFVIAAHRVFDSKMQKQSQGLLILLSAISAEYIEETRYMSDYDFSMHPAKVFSDIKTLATHETGYKIVQDDTQIHIYSVLYDIFGNAALCVELRHDRSMAALGLNLTRKNFLLMLGLGLTILLLSFSIIHRAETRIMRREVAYRLGHDNLTGLANKSLIPQRVGMILQLAQNKGSMAAVLLIHLNRIREVNDSYGYDHGDHIIKEVASRLSRVISSGCVARSGGDKFLIAAEGAQKDHFEALSQAALNALLQPFPINDDNEVHLGANIGVACYPTNGKDSRLLIHRAELAMYEARTQGEDIYLFFTDAMEEDASRKLKLESALYDAIENNDLSVHYQPKVRVTSRDVAGCEALVRWLGKDGKFIPPPLFIPLAEECGLVTKIDMFVLRMACRQIREWLKEGIAVPIAVNMSTRSILSPGFSRAVMQILQEECVPTSFIELEITETCLMANLNTALDVIEQLHAYGIHFALDDFGTGYSSLQYLSSMPISCLKIDKKFVDDIFSGKKTAQSLIKSILSLAANLGMTTVSEGVEDRRQLDFLLDNGASVIQGYFFSKPLNGEECTIFLRNRKTRIASVMEYPAS
ncbi:MAG: bifunctional diguanylate cyclase/phosphodiesterase, partial [Desulfovibrio sp.]|nr:bifunctional diguanylate cyclase/phosphodiesterase [Desulfovibrio sp.]